MTDSGQRFDVIVLGATPGGIAATVAASRLGRSVLLVEYHGRIGGMSASGLGKSDIEKRHLIGGLFREFTVGVKTHYRERYGEASPDFRLCQDGFYFEPSVAESVFREMLDRSPRVSLLTGQRLVRAEAPGGVLTSVEIADRRTDETVICEADIFIDATYEGDLLAAAGAAFRLGRESRDDFGEPHAGHIYYDYESGTILPRSTGRGDDRLPAYTYRLCLTTDPENAFVLTGEPDDYDRALYAGYFDDLAAGRLGAPGSLKPGRGYHPSHFDTMVRALSVTDLPNRKTDVNINPRPLAFPFPEMNAGYPAAGEGERLHICKRHRNVTLGLLWFLQNDPEIPAVHREIARRYHLPLDEFGDTGHFPFQLYIREARRLVGEYTLTERDMISQTPRHHPDTVAIGEFPIDSFPCRRRQPGDTVVLEGYLGMLDTVTRPYEIPYRIMIPEKVDGLIVPVAASTTHVAFSSIRMEPTWMALGQAAGTAAHLALKGRSQPRSISTESLRRQLRADGQILNVEPTPQLNS